MTTKNFIALLCSLYLSLSLFTCIDPIDFSQPEVIQDAISIQGKLTKGNPSTVSVQISEVFDYSGVSRRIDAKYVALIDDSGNRVELVSTTQGLYNLDILPEIALKVEYGKGYQIKTELNNGEVYASAFDTLYPITEARTLSVQKKQEVTTNNAGTRDTVNFMEFRTSTIFPVFEGKKVNLLWEMESTFKLTDSPAFYSFCLGDCQPTNLEKLPKTCFVNINSVQNYKTLGTRNLSGSEVNDFVLLKQEANSFIFSEGYYLTVFQQSLSGGAYEYWSTVEQLTNREGTIFEAPAGRVTSNIRNIENPKASVFGYFFATEPSMQRIFVAPTLANFPRTVCPVLPNPDGSGPGNCCNCLCEPNSSTEQPEWWVE